MVSRFLGVFMRALQFSRFGEPAEVLKVVDLVQQPLAENEVRVQVEAAALNPSDIVNVQGRFPHTVLPRVPGRDFAGTIVAGPRELVGWRVWGSGGDLGFTRDGAHAEYLDIPTNAVSRRPANISAAEAAAVGVPFLTASNIFERTRMRAGHWVIVTGAAGAVGFAAIELARAWGARVIALIKDDAQRARLNMDKVASVATSAAGNLQEVVKETTGGRGADIALNGLGADMLPELFASLADGGRVAVYSVLFAGKDAPIDLLQFYRHRRELIGINNAHVTLAQSAAMLSNLQPLFDSGELAPPRIGARYRLDEGAAAYAAVRAAPGKVVLMF